VVPLNVQLDYDLIVERIQKHKAGYDIVEDKDIVIFIGNTGAGKTTTILYLAGKEIKEQSVKIKFTEGVEVEDFKLCCADAMPGFVIGHNPTSETIAANSYDCSISGLTLVDFAGQLDTNGHEIEIANTVGLFNTLSRVRTVRLVLVIDFKAIETLKGQIFKNSLDYMHSFVPNLHEKFSSLAVLFTHDASLRKLRVELAKLKAANTNSEQAPFLEHLIKYVNEHGEHLLVEPTNSLARAGVEGVIKSSIPMDANSDSFQFYIPNESRMLLIERLKGVLSVVQHHLRTYAWPQVKQPIEDLFLLATEISMMREVVEIFANAKAMTIKAAQDLIAKIYTLIDIHDYKAVDTHLSYLISANRIRDYIKSSVDIETSFKDIRDVINTRMLAAAKDIEIAESYMLARQKLDLVKDISSNLQSHLTDTNKGLAAKLEHSLQERVKKQFADIKAQIDSLSKTGNFFVEASEKYLTELLAYNLSKLAEVDKLFDGCTHYFSATDDLNKVIALHCGRFISELPKEPTSQELSLNFRVLKEVNRCQSLLSHTSVESQSCYSKVEKALLQLLEELNNSVGMYAVNFNFAPIAQVIMRIHAMSRIDIEFCAQFLAEKLAQTITQLQALVTNIISEVQKKAEEELNSSTVDGSKFIRLKAEILVQATKVEREFSDPTIVSSFLTCLHEDFQTKARRLLNILDEALTTTTFG